MKRKYLIIIIIVATICIVSFLIISIIKNSAYEKKAKQSQVNIHELYTMSSLLSSKIQETWSSYIFDDIKYIDRRTGLFYATYSEIPNKENANDEDIEYCYDFSKAIVEKYAYYANKGVTDTLDSIYYNVKTLLTEMTPAPYKFKSLHKDLNELFHTAESMYNCATSPKGNIQFYSSTINSISLDYKKQSSNIDIQIGEIEKEEKFNIQLKYVFQFL